MSRVCVHETTCFAADRQVPVEEPVREMDPRCSKRHATHDGRLQEKFETSDGWQRALIFFIAAYFVFYK